MSEVDDVKNEQSNVLKIVVGHWVDEHIEDDNVCRPKVDPTIVERPIVHHVADDFIDNGDEQCHIKVDQATMNDSDEPRTYIFN